MATNKEQIYDERIDPLMGQILAICQAHGIAMIASFYIPTPEDTELCCTSCLPDGDGKNGPGHLESLDALGAAGLSPAIAMTITLQQ